MLQTCLVKTTTIFFCFALPYTTFFIHAHFLTCSLAVLETGLKPVLFYEIGQLIFDCLRYLLNNFKWIHIINATISSCVSESCKYIEPVWKQLIYRQKMDILSNRSVVIRVTSVIKPKTVIKRWSIYRSYWYGRYKSGNEILSQKLLCCKKRL